MNVHTDTHTDSCMCSVRYGYNHNAHYYLSSSVNPYHMSVILTCGMDDLYTPV